MLQLPQHGAVPQVYPIEVAYRQHASMVLGTQVMDAADQLHDNRKSLLPEKSPDYITKPADNQPSLTVFNWRGRTPSPTATSR